MRILPLSACLVAMSAQAQISTDLIGYWEFENNLTETSGVHGAGLHDGVESGTVAYAASTDVLFGQALDLDGTNGVYIQNSANTEGGYAGTFDADINTANSISISFWANGALGRWNPFVCKHGEGTEGWQVRRNNNTSSATFTMRSMTGVADPAGVNAAATSSGWRHFLAVWDGATGTRKLYIDGVEDTTLTTTGDTSSGGPGNALDKFLTIGMYDAGAATFSKNFNGQIDDVAIWSRALTDLEALHLSTNPLSYVDGKADTDLDGLLDVDEVTLGTSTTLADTDSDGVNDFDEVLVGSDPLNDNDHDGDGLSNLVETSGSANTAFGNESTDWNNVDSDGDGIEDDEEVIAGVDTYVTNPNAVDTDGDGWADNIELAATPPSDPTNILSVPSVDTGLIGYWQFENDLTEVSGAHAVGLHDGVAEGTIAYVANPDTDFGQALSLDGSNGVIIQNSADTDNLGAPIATYAGTFDADVNTANALTISFWKNGAIGPNWNPFISKDGEADGWQVRRRQNKAYTIFTVRDTNGADDPIGSNISATATGWIHIVAVWDGASGTRKIYIDGVEDTTFTNDVGNIDTSAGGPGNAISSFLTIGMRDNGATFGNNFTGEIDDVAIWSRALSDSEIVLLSSNPLDVVLTNTDTDGDGLFDDDEVNVHGTNPGLADTDADGVNDFDEVQAGSDALNDNDFDLDGLTNLEETSGSENTFGNAVTGWNVADSDFDGILDGEEVILGADGFVTDPLDADTDDDGFSDGAETSADPVSDPTDGGVALLTEWQRDLCGYWKFDNDLTDGGFLGLDGAMGGDELTSTYVTGKFGQAIDLDKSNNQRVEVSGDENYLDAVGTSVTVSAWVTVEAFNDDWQGIIGKGEQSWRLARRHSSNGVAFAAGSGNDTASNNDTANLAPINDGNWHHVVGVAEFGVAMRIYVDGYLLEERLGVLPNVADVVNSVWIGGNPDTVKTWNGNIDDTAVWKRALSAEEVYAIYADGNDIQYLIDNDVVPGVIPPQPDPVLTVVSSGLVGGDFEIELTGMVPANSYDLWVTESLDPADVFWFNIEGPITGVISHTFSESDPLSLAPSGFYKIIATEPVE